MIFETFLMSNQSDTYVFDDASMSGRFLSSCHKRDNAWETLVVFTFSFSSSVNCMTETFLCVVDLKAFPQSQVTRKQQSTPTPTALEGRMKVWGKVGIVCWSVRLRGVRLRAKGEGVRKNSCHVVFVHIYKETKWSFPVKRIMEIEEARHDEDHSLSQVLADASALMLYSHSFRWVCDQIWRSFSYPM